MAFSQKVKEVAFVTSGRCCCLCHKFCGTKMEVHHIEQKEDGGPDIFDNAIPLEQFIVVTNHKFISPFSTWAADKKNVVVLDDGTESNETRLGAVKDIQPTVEGIEDDVFVMAGDNVLDFSLVPFTSFAASVGTSCVMAHTEERLEALRKTAMITVDEENRITSYEEKLQEPRGHLAVPPFYYYKHTDIIIVSAKKIVVYNRPKESI